MKMVEKEDVEVIVDHFEAQANRFREQTEAKNPREGASTQDIGDRADAGTVKISEENIPQNDKNEAEEREQKDREIMALNLKIRELEEALKKANDAASKIKKKDTEESIHAVRERDSVILSSKLRDRILSCMDPEQKDATYARILLIRMTKIHVALNEALYLFQRDGAYMNNLLQRVKDAAIQLYLDDMFEDEFERDMEKEPSKSWLRPVCSLIERCLFWAGRHMFEVGVRFKHEKKYDKALSALRQAMLLFQTAEEYHNEKYGGECNCDIGPLIEEWKHTITTY